MKNNVLEKNNKLVFSSITQLPNKEEINSDCSIGEIIINIREKKNIERKELAELLNITYDRLFDIENDRQFPSIRSSILFCSIFNIDINNFLNLLLEKKIQKQTDSLKKTFEKNVKECLDDLRLLAG